MQANGLVLATHRGESVIIDLREWGLGLVEVLTVEIRHHDVRTLYAADRRIPIHRKKVFDAIEAKGCESLALEFVIREIDGGGKRQSAFVPGTDGVLCVQFDHTDQGHAYSVLHAPTGRVVPTFAFSKAESAAEAALAYWKTMTDDQRSLMKSSDADAIFKNKELATLCRSVLGALSDINVIRDNCGVHVKCAV